MVTLLHTADTHLGYRQYHRPEREADFRDAFYQVIGEAVNREVDAVVHAGDLFNSSRPGIDALSDALEGLKRLREAGIPFLSIVGNHDGTRDRQWLDVFASLGLATRLDDSGFSIRSEEPDGNGTETTGAVSGGTGDGNDEPCHVVLYGLDHVEPGRRDRLDYAFGPERASEADAAVLVAHGLFSPFPNGDWDARAICRQSSVEFDAILAGDDHTNQETTLSEFGTLLTYPGSTERTAADQRAPRGFDLVRVSSAGEIELDFQELSTRKFVYVDVELDEGEGVERVLDALDEREAERRETSEGAETEGGEETEESRNERSESGRERDEETRAGSGPGFEEAVVVVTLTGAGERVSSGPVEERGLAHGALTVRVSDRREHSEELEEYGEVAFADPERAVEKRREALGLSEHGREIETLVRDTTAVPDSNVTDVTEERVREWLDEPFEAFERTEPVDESTLEGGRGSEEADGDEREDEKHEREEGESRRTSNGSRTESTDGSDEAGVPAETGGSGEGKEGERTEGPTKGAKAEDEGERGEEEPAGAGDDETGDNERSEEEAEDAEDGRTTQATLWD